MKRSCMRTFLDILSASLITIILYIGLYFIWGTIARESQNEKIVSYIAFSNDKHRLRRNFVLHNKGEKKPGRERDA